MYISYHRNQQIIGYCIDRPCPNQRPYCHFCLPRHGQHLDRLTSQELFNEWIQQRILSAHNVQKNVQECKLSFDSLLNLLIPYINFNIQQFSEIGISQIDIMIKGLFQLEGCEEILFKQFKQSVEQIKQIIDQILKKIKNQTNQKEKCNQQSQNSDRKQLILEESQHLSNFKINSNQFTFELMNQDSIKQDNNSYALAFNKDQSIILAGCSKDIKVFEHQQGKLNQVQLLSMHTSSYFKFYEKDQQFCIWKFRQLNYNMVGDWKQLMELLINIKWTFWQYILFIVKQY
ncbi:unnamed protein product [Paramecium pentaurelia]|uniref:Uncharacterized protein n=1 Tax=Paramecium pentaurelia TaxID=43138 RepID=A0A8S1XBU7_9CILI|nr:unnamed protein product [Paramecium pentaurelia]